MAPGTAKYAGIIEMINAARKFDEDAVLIIAGAFGTFFLSRCPGRFKFCSMCCAVRQCTTLKPEPQHEIAILSTRFLG